MLALLASLAVAAEPANWEKAESTHLRNVRQLTSDFARAGEGYFSPDGKTIIFQAEEKGTGNPFYQIFTTDLATGRTRRVSPGVGKTTCSYFAPDGRKIIFASSHLDPDAKAHYAEELKLRDEDQRTGRHRRYKWDFDPYMTIFEADPDGGNLKPLTHARGYNAEGSYSPDGKQIVFCSNRGGEKDLELYVMDRDGSNVRQLTHAPGCYNGGPFFSPDSKKVIFRSDRKEKDRLQLYVINADGTGERALTDDPNWVQWGPYWYKDGRHIVYAGADHSVAGRPNYDLYWMDTADGRRSVNDGDTKGLRREPRWSGSAFSPLSALSTAILYPFRTEEPDPRPAPGKPVRLTYFPGADVLPVFSPDYKKIMWTSTRGSGGSSQLFIADFLPPKD